MMNQCRSTSCCFSPHLTYPETSSKKWLTTTIRCKT
uniref:Uncharacterized protein n=1 Tax=Arundo donax TaxID=35708 RepID=A0A0A9FCU7_ARUDO